MKGLAALVAAVVYAVVSNLIYLYIHSDPSPPLVICCLQCSSKADHHPSAEIGERLPSKFRGIAVHLPASREFVPQKEPR